MHSLKNTVVAVLLLGVSYGVYYVLMTPDPATLENESSTDLVAEAPELDTGVDPPESDNREIPPGMESMESPGFETSIDRGTSGFATAPPRDNNGGGTFSPTPPPIAASQPSGSGTGQLIPPDIVQRQPRLDFGNDGSSNRLVGGSEPVGANRESTAPHDQVLIDAIRQEVESDMNIFLPEDNSNPTTAAAPPVASPSTGGAFGSSNANTGEFSGGSFGGSSTRVHTGPQQESPTGGQFIENQFVSTSPRTSGASAPEAREPVITPLVNNAPAFEPPANGADPAPAQPSATGTAPAEGQKTLGTSWPHVQRMMDEGNFRGALGTLSRFYTDPTLTQAENDQLMTWLDSLAGKVIYSPEHNLFRNAYTVQAGETINDLASRWNVTPHLIYNVNRSNIANPAELQPGTELKMLTGPFHAEVNLESGIMTLFVKNLYAGRFQIQFAHVPTLEPGAYSVVNKSRDLANDGWTIELENGASIKTMTAGEMLPGNCVGLHPDDSDDVFGILTETSRIFVR